MKKIVMIFAAMAAVLSSCQKSELESVSANDGKDIVLNISVSNPGAGDTKAPIKSAWADGDVISIWYDTNNDTNPDLVIEYDAANTKWIQKQGAAVSGNTPSEGSGKYAKALYNGTVKVASNDDYTFENSTLTFNIANWTFLTEVQVVVKGLTSASAGSYTLACDKFTPLASTGDGYTVGSDAITASAGTKGATVTGISNTDGVAFVFATADYSTSSTDKKDFTFTLKDNTSGSEVTKVYKPNVAIESKTNKSAIKALTIESSKFAKAVPDGFVDLGLSSGIFWAEKNLGASKPEDFGKYYSWGDVNGQPQPLSGETFSQAFSWTNDVFGQTFDKVEEATACPGGVLAPTYDVAYRTDNAWRMPTTEDFVNLFKECYAEWGTYNSVDGLIVYKAKSADDKGYAYFNSKMKKYSGSGNNWDTTTDKTRPSYSTASDTFLFFPAAGLGGTPGGSKEFSNDGDGYYWSSSLFLPSQKKYAFYLYFYSDDVKPQSGNYRYYGRQVRPVSD